MIGTLIQSIPSMRSDLFRGTDLYAQIEEEVLESAKTFFGENKPNRLNIEGIGEIHLPFFSMGNINTIHLFGLDELILLAYYAANKGKYKLVADIGANVGLHSIILAKLGYSVTAFEPDPVHCEELLKNLTLNRVHEKVELCRKAVSNKVGEVSFTRVKGNTTGNHISGTRSPYGATDQFAVKTEQFRNILTKNHLVKADVEGHEAVLISSTVSEDWNNADAIFEVGSEQNAENIFNHLKKIDISIFSQKIGWQRVTAHTDLPFSHRDGSIFITKKGEMTW